MSVESLAVSTDTELYKHYDEKCVLLYVGVSTNGLARRYEHNKHSAWASKIRFTTTDRYGSRAEALDAERHFIRNERPIYNVVHSRAKQCPHRDQIFNIKLLRESAALGCGVKTMVQAVLPHSDTSEVEIVSVIGNRKLIMTANDPDVGLPYGSIPRLLMARLGAEFLITGNKEIRLGESVSQLCRELGMTPTGGVCGTLTRLREQIYRLYCCSVVVVADGVSRHVWDPEITLKSINLSCDFDLPDGFCRELIATPLVLDLSHMCQLARSPMALDVYTWLVCQSVNMRQSRRRAFAIPWSQIRAQFGAEYKEPRDFKKSFLRALDRVRSVVPVAIDSEHNKKSIIISRMTAGSLSKKKM